MLVRRSDLALEAQALCPDAGVLRGVASHVRDRDGFPVTTVEVTSPEGARALGKPVGSYVTLDLDPLLSHQTEAFSRAASVLAAELRALLPGDPGSPVLVVGLGNRNITPDLLGPLALDHTLVTRHLVSAAPAHFGDFRPVSALAPGVLSDTGMESAEITAAVSSALHPACVIVVDALASRSLSRLCRTVQLSDTGISPGSGVGNHRMALDQETLGVPVLSVGVPTVVEASTLALDILEESGLGDVEPEALCGCGEDLFVTPREIDAQIATLAKLLGYGLSMALNPQLSLEDLMALLE